MPHENHESAASSCSFLSLRLFWSFEVEIEWTEPKQIQKWILREPSCRVSCFLASAYVVFGLNAALRCFKECLWETKISMLQFVTGRNYWNFDCRLTFLFDQQRTTIAQLKAAIDKVSAQLRAKESLSTSSDNNVALEPAAWFVGAFYDDIEYKNM